MACKNGDVKLIIQYLQERTGSVRQDYIYRKYTTISEFYDRSYPKTECLYYEF